MGRKVLFNYPHPNPLSHAGTFRLSGERRKTLGLLLLALLFFASACASPVIKEGSFLFPDTPESVEQWSAGNDP
jgi:hypothetical protein